MTSRRRARRRLVMTLAGGCTAGGPGPTPETPGERGPLDELLDAGLGVDRSAPDAVQQSIAQIIRREDATAACTKAQGFEYLPNVPDAT